jgi:small subunit ribosomal protein S21
MAFGESLNPCRNYTLDRSRNRDRAIRAKTASQVGAFVDIRGAQRDGAAFRRLRAGNSCIIKEAIWRVWRWDFLAEVRVQEGEPLENALRRFKRKVQQEDIIKEVKRHSYYLKPGEKRRVKAALARKRNRKKARKEAD